MKRPAVERPPDFLDERAAFALRPVDGEEVSVNRVSALPVGVGRIVRALVHRHRSILERPREDAEDIPHIALARRRQGAQDVGPVHREAVDAVRESL
jgi:hypothetical protein